MKTEQIIEGVEDNNNFTINKIEEVLVHVNANVNANTQKTYKCICCCNTKHWVYVLDHFIVYRMENHSAIKFSWKMAYSGKGKKCLRTHLSHDFLLSLTGMIFFRQNGCI